MAQAAGVRWEELSSDARRALEWGRVAEPAPALGTRGLLIGMLRIGEPADGLLRHFGISKNVMLEALGREVPVRPIFWPGNERPSLGEMPPLTENAQRCIDRAAELRTEIGRTEIDVECLFGALLDTDGGSARRALADTVKLIADVGIEEVRDVTFEWLRENDLIYAETLAQRFPPEGLPGFPYIGVLRTRVRYENGEEEHPITGLGALLPGGELLTAAQLAPAATDAVLVLFETTHGVRTLTSDGRVTVLGLAPAPGVPEGASRQVVSARPGQVCNLMAVDDHAPSVTPLTGTVRAPDGEASERFALDLEQPLQDTQIATGSPVTDAAGAIVGVVGTAGTNRSLEVIGAARIRRLLDVHARAAPRLSATEIGDLSGAGNDVVGDVDQLGFQAYVDAFADLITSPHTQPPLTIGIFGSWGMGKSFLLEHIEREINARQASAGRPGPRVHVVRFNAWEYSAMEVVWPALVRTIVTRLDKLSTWPRHKRIWTRVRWNLARQWRHLRVQLIAGALAIGTAIAAAVASGQSDVAGAIGGVAALLGLGGVLKAAKDPVAQWVTALFADSDYGRQLRVMEDIKHDLETLEERLHGTNAAGEDVVTGRILVLIDDLDRCEPAKAVEVLQAVNLLLNFDSFIVCLGIDARIVTGAVEKHYEGLLGKAGASGYEYLDKIVQIPFRIPRPGRDDIVAFVAGQLGNPVPPSERREREREREASSPERAGARDDDADGGDAGARIAASADGAGASGGGDPAARDDPDDAGERGNEAGSERDTGPEAGRERDTRPGPGPDAGVPFTYDEQQAFELFADYLRPNPRHLKRLVNVYRLVRSLAWAQQEPVLLVRPAATIRWLIMWGQWPYASLAMVERFEQMLDAGDEIAVNVPAGDPLLALLDDVEREGLDAEIRGRLDDDAETLRKLLSVEGCSLSWDEIRRFRRFTVNFNPAVEEQVRRPRPRGTGTE